MKAARLYGPREVHIEDVPQPLPGPGEVLIRVRACAICASDVRLYLDGHAGGVVPDHPMIQGHEFSGDIVELGESVTGPPVGTRVAVEPSWHCGHCDLCLQGLHNLCRNVIFPSFPQRDGALAEYIACPVHAVCPIPSHVGYTSGALTEPLGVALHATRIANLKPDSRVVIQGAGMIGICTELVLLGQGRSDIAVVEPVDGRRALASRLGASRVAASAQGLHEAGVEGEVVFECSGSPDAVMEGIGLTRPAGQFVVVGIPRPEHVTIDFAVPRRKQLDMLFSRRSLDTLNEAVELVASGRVNLGAVPTRHFALEQAVEAIEATAAAPGDMLRAVVIP